jgi:hypothetical protein
MLTYQVEGDVEGVLVAQVGHKGDEDEENPHPGGFDEDPQDGLRVNKVTTILA